jgi:SAM-dependent methyltransferase
MTLQPAPRYSETERIREVYQRYDTSRRWQRKRDLSNPGFTQLQQERWTAIHAILAERLRYPVSPRVLDIGCGTGGDLVRIARLLPDAELHGVDLSQARIEAARQAVPGADLRVQGAEALRVTSEDGVLLVYDMRLPSPANRNVRAIGKRELRALLPGSRICAQAIMVLPPIARTVCRVWPRTYRHLARISPLRSHYLSVVTGEPRISSEPFPSGDENEPSHNQASPRAS